MKSVQRPVLRHELVALTGPSCPFSHLFAFIVHGDETIQRSNEIPVYQPTFTVYSIFRKEMFCTA